jgi:hypothetical protein
MQEQLYLVIRDPNRPKDAKLYTETDLRQVIREQTEFILETDDEGRIAGVTKLTPNLGHVIRVPKKQENT